MLSDKWLSRYGLLENFNASVTRTRTRTGTRTGTGTGTWTTGVTAIALCTSCSRAKNISWVALDIANPIDPIHLSIRILNQVAAMERDEALCLPRWCGRSKSRDLL